MKKLAFMAIAALLCLIAVSTAMVESYLKFDLEKKAVTLNSGYEMPILR